MLLKLVVAGVVLGISPLEVHRVLGVGVGHLVTLHPHTGQEVVVGGLRGLLRVPTQTFGCAMQQEELVDMDQHHVDTGGHGELQTFLLGELSDFQVAVLKILDAWKVVCLCYKAKTFSFHYVHCFETLSVAL